MSQRTYMMERLGIFCRRNLASASTDGVVSRTESAAGPIRRGRISMGLRLDAAVDAVRSTVEDCHAMDSLPENPHIVSRENLDRIFRLNRARSALLSIRTLAFTSPSSGIGAASGLSEFSA